MDWIKNLSWEWQNNADIVVVDVVIQQATIHHHTHPFFPMLATLYTELNTFPTSSVIALYVAPHNSPISHFYVVIDSKILKSDLFHPSPTTTILHNSVIEILKAMFEN